MKIFILAILVTVIAITAMAFTACTKKRETQTATAVTAGSYAKILNGDLSDFAGTWVDGFGTKSQLRADGVFTSGSMGDLKADGFSMHDYGAYVWNVRDGDGYGGFGVMVYPPGVPINLFYMDGGVRKIAETIETDTTKVRITAGQEGPYSSAEVYYRESESLTQTHNADEYEGYPGEDYEALPLGFGYPYTAILEGDLSEFAGTWVNKRGGIYPLKADGVFDGGLNAYEFTRGVDKNSPFIANGTNYEWLVNMGGEAGVFEIWLFPAGVDIKNHDGEIIQTDKTKDRIVFEYITTSDDVYYLTGEASSLPQEPAELTGEWHSRTITGSCYGQGHYIFTADGYYKKGDLYPKHDGTWSLLRDAAKNKYHLTLQYKEFIDFESGWTPNNIIEYAEYETDDPNNISLLLHGTGWVELTRCNNPGWSAQ